MIPNDINSLAALELLQRAMQSKTESCADLLIESACRLDKALPKEYIKAARLESWLKDNQNRSKP